MTRLRWTLIALAVVLLIAGVTLRYWYTHRHVVVVVDPACPAVLTNTSDATDDYGDTVQWDGRTWWRTEGRTSADIRVGSVTCSISALDTHGLRFAPGAWPDGTATALPRGTTLHLPREDRAEEALVAHTPDGDVLYCLEDLGEPTRC